MHVQKCVRGIDENGNSPKEMTIFVVMCRYEMYSIETIDNTVFSISLTPKGKLQKFRNKRKFNLSNQFSIENRNETFEKFRVMTKKSYPCLRYI